MRKRETKVKSAKASTEVVENKLSPPLIVDTEPAHLFVLPVGISKDARFVLLPNPATSQLCRYIYCPVSGFYEFTKVASPNHVPQSCLLVHDSAASRIENAATNSIPQQGDSREVGAMPSQYNGHVLEDSSVLVATPFDPVFFLLPLFEAGLFTGDSQRANIARTIEDHFDILGNQSKHMEQLLCQSNVRKLLESCMRLVADQVDTLVVATYRPNPLLFISALKGKILNMLDRAWPASLEIDVQKQLEIPISSVNGCGSMVDTVEKNVDDNGGNEPDTANNGNDHTRLKIEADPIAECRDSTMARPKDDNLLSAMRVRVAMKYIICSYVPPKLRGYFESVALSESFFPQEVLNQYLERIRKLKDEAQILRTLSDNFSRKRAADDDDEAAEERAQKKRKKEEEEKKKKSGSKAIKALQNTDTTGMKKLSSFFDKSTTSR